VTGEKYAAGFAADGPGAIGDKYAYSRINETTG